MSSMVIQSLINAQKANIDLTCSTGRVPSIWPPRAPTKSVEDAVHTFRQSASDRLFRPREAPKEAIDGVAKDGIMIKARARVTVRTNLSSFVGGATEDTIVARVGEGIVSSIGSEAKLQGRTREP